ncbi:MAG TPA: Gfo/Idh/MocA family oxidoreductase, partial [Streptomyces sp.]|nr:Gfo/Idh/MocA family oxidoreductase [Streptomyces sp.]
MRFGLLGTGPWAELAHGPALRDHPGVELAGVWGRRPEAAADLAGRLGCRPYDDVDALIADCDAVAVALPPDIQAPLAVRAAEAGRHLLLDKPVATQVEDARAIAAAVERTAVASVVFFTMRFR